MRTTTARVLAVVAVAAALVAGCQPGEEPMPEETTSDEATDGPSEVPTDEPTEEPTTEPTDASPSDDRTQAAVDDLAERLGLETDQIIVGDVEQVTWPDGSIGCPTPGESYTQALVDGARVVLTVTGTDYAYHAEGDGPFAYCANPSDPVPTDDR